MSHRQADRHARRTAEAEPAEPALSHAVSNSVSAPPTRSTTNANGNAQANPTDANFAQQWHLLQTQPGLLDLNVVPVWDDYTGVGINTWVFDNGFDYLHSDLVGNYNQAIDIDYVGGVIEFDAAPEFSDDNHGTHVMGLIGAARNGDKLVGIAYNSEIVGIRGYTDDQTQVNDSQDDFIRNLGDGARYAADNFADVLNISAGASAIFDFGINTAINTDTLADWQYAVATGRGGLGLNIVKSAGNSRQQFEDVNHKSVDASVLSITVAAVQQSGFIDDYSSFGSGLLVSGFGTPGEVVTTDNRGAAGASLNDVHTGFNGTSSAAPMVAGVVTLMLDANEGLGWRDVQTILSATARHVGTAVGASAATGNEFYLWQVNGANTWNGGGMHFSNDYGFGLVDALAAVRLSETWLFSQAANKSSNLVATTLDLTNTAQLIPDNSLTGLFLTGAEAENVAIEYTTVTVTMSPSHTYTEQLGVSVRSPDGTISILKSSGTGGDTDFPGTWTFTTFAFKGEHSGGQWAVFFSDNFPGDTGTVTDVVVKSYGGTSVNDTYVFTNEYDKFLNTGRTQIYDANGGIDTFNASAVTAASRINLNDGLASIIDGVVLVTNGSIENAIGGDGGDTITGNASANKLWGMRGDDVIAGGDGADNLAGERGNDFLTGGLGADAIDGGVGIDTADYREKTASVIVALNGAVFAGVSVGGLAEDQVRNVETVLGGANADRLFGDAAANTLVGYGGNDTIRGGLGRDFLDGGAGIDTLDFGDKTAAVVVALNGATNAVVSVGGVAEDAVRNFEIVYGGSAADTLTGDGFSNVLRGSGGADQLNGGAGVDWADFRDETAAIVLTLAGAAAATATIGGVAQDVVRNIENAYGGGGNDVLYGDALANELSGFAGADALRGFGGADRLVGGLGADRFIFNALSESTVATSGRDTIVDFNRAEGDQILLGLIDANTVLAGNQAFVLGALQAGQAGRLQIGGAAGNWLVQGDVDGDGAADFALLLTSAPTPIAGDFVL